MDRVEKVQGAKLIDHNLGSKGLERLVCDKCQSGLWHQKGAPTPLCPNCYTKGSVVKMRKYFSLGGVINAPRS
jgi:hypothetical protein